MTEVMVVENIPMLLNLGDWGTTESVIGWATVYRDPEAETARLDVRMSEEGSKLLEHLEEIAEIKAIGFAGIMRRPQ